MCSRTNMKQQIMRKKVMNERNPEKEILNDFDGNYFNVYKSNHNYIPHGNTCLPSMPQTANDLEKSYVYCKTFVNNPDKIEDLIHDDGDKLRILTIDYKDNSNNNNISPFLRQNICATDNKYTSSFNTDYNQHSPRGNNSMDYNSHFLNKILPNRNMRDYESSFSCPVTLNQAISASSQRNNSNSELIESQKTNFSEIKTHLKDRNKKASHNRIERKRRDFINQQIMELSRLLPSQVMMEGESKKNKGNILKNSVAYIHNLRHETMIAHNYLQETVLAFTLVESYRKQIQELQHQSNSQSSLDLVSSTCNINLAEDYIRYIKLHDQNLSVTRSNKSFKNQQLSEISTKNSESDLKSTVCLLENESVFKIEEGSVHSSVGTNSLSTTYRIDEETDIDSFNETLSPKEMQQLTKVKYSILPSSHIGCLADDQYTNESMICLQEL